MNAKDVSLFDYALELKKNAMNRVDTSNRQSGTILIVDDDGDALRWTQRIVTSVCPHLGTKAVHSGPELIDYLKGDGGFSDRTAFPYPVLILLDLSMPGMHGFEVLAWLGTHPPHDRVPAVVTTGSGETLVAHRAYKLGARSFLTKPLRADELKDTLATISKIENWMEPPISVL